MDPFANTVGDYNAIMGNTGGDNWVEFDYRAPHAIWYESPKFGGLNFNVLYSPGQQISGNPADIANGEGILCNGANNGGIVNGTQAGASGQGGFAPASQSCSDGGFTSVFSANLNYNWGPLLLTAAAERHNNVDCSGNFTIIPSTVTVPASGAGISVENETAYKIGASYKFGSVGSWGSNTVSGIFERLTRGGPADERNRSGWFLSDVQKFGKNDLMLSWAHAGQADNTNTSNPGCYPNGVCTAITNSLNGTGSLDDKANLLAVGLRHNFTRDVNVYAVYAQDTNAPAGHFGLGESGHGLPDTPNGTAGEKFRAVSVGGVITF